MKDVIILKCQFKSTMIDISSTRRVQLLHPGRLQPAVGSPLWRDIGDLLYGSIGPVRVNFLSREDGYSGFEIICRRKEVRDMSLSTLAETAPNQFDLCIYRRNSQTTQILTLRCPEMGAASGGTAPPEESMEERSVFPTPQPAAEDLLQALREMTGQMEHLTKTQASQEKAIRMLMRRDDDKRREEVREELEEVELEEV